MEQRNFSNKTFTYRILIIIGIVVIAALFLLSFGYFSYVLLLVFAGVLLAVFLRGLAELLSSHTPFSIDWSLVVVAILLLEVITILVLWLGPVIADSFQKFAQAIPQIVNHLQEFLEGHPTFEQVLRHFLQQEQPLPRDIFARIAGIFSTVAGLIIGIVVVLFNGIYLSIDPEVYINGIVRLLPHDERERARAVFSELEYVLRWWMLGRISSMIVIGILTWVGLIILGIPSAAALAFFAMLVTFIPNLGPVLSAVPAVLIAWLQGPMMAVYVIVLYTVVQFIETYLVTPFIQRKAIRLPQALILTVQLAMGFAFGILGLLLATPLALVVLVLVQMLYVEDILEDKVKLT